MEIVDVLQLALLLCLLVGVVFLLNCIRTIHRSHH